MKAAPIALEERVTKKVVVRICDENNAQSSDTFRLCPLGIQFYSKKPLNEFDLFEFSLDLDEKKTKKKSAVPVTCTGAVVRCQKDKDNGLYRVWIQFIDLPEATRKKIKCVARDGKTLCSYCENF
jgi:hypothetical protein